MNMRQVKLVTEFVRDSKYYMIKIDDTTNGEIGKIINGEDLIKLDLDKNEVYRSIEYKNDNVLFVYDLKSNLDNKVKNPLSLLKSNLEEARVIEKMYPEKFTWVFDGLSIKAMAVVPSGINSAHSTISRYGGTYMFISILRQHLSNIGKMVKGVSPDFSFLKNKTDMKEKELSIGSKNSKTNLYSIIIDLEEYYMSIIKHAMKCESKDINLRLLDMKFWSREINPDFVVDSRVSKLEKALPLDEAYIKYPQPIKKVMALEFKGQENRDIIARFLLSIHDYSDAKHIYYSVLGDEELIQVKKVGSNNWNYSVNNHKKYGCPTNEELKEFIDDDYTLNHPLQEIQEFLDDLYKEEDDDIVGDYFG